LTSAGVELPTLTELTALRMATRKSIAWADSTEKRVKKIAAPPRRDNSLTQKLRFSWDELILD